MRQETMLSFHNDQKVKDKYVSRVRAHQKADEIVQGVYWERGKGCAVGCTIHGDDHAEYERSLGLPEWLSHVEERLFEGLSNGRAKLFPLGFLEAIPVGVPLEEFERVKWAFLSFVLGETLSLEGLWREQDKKDAYVRSVVGAVQEVRVLCNRAAAGRHVSDKERAAAMSAAMSAERAAAESSESAWAAAESAWSVAMSVRFVAESVADSAMSAADSAWSVAMSVRSAVSAAGAAGYSAADSAGVAAVYAARAAGYSAADSAADSAACQRMTAHLLHLLKNTAKRCNDE